MRNGRIPESRRLPGGKGSASRNRDGSTRRRSRSLRRPTSTNNRSSRLPADRWRSRRKVPSIPSRRHCRRASTSRCNPSSFSWRQSMFRCFLQRIRSARRYRRPRPDPRLPEAETRRSARNSVPQDSATTMFPHDPYVALSHRLRRRRTGRQKHS